VFRLRPDNDRGEGGVRRAKGASVMGSRRFTRWSLIAVVALLVVYWRRHRVPAGCRFPQGQKAVEALGRESEISDIRSAGPG